MHKCVMEAMECNRWKSFLDSLSEDKEDQTLQVMVKLEKSFPGEPFIECANSDPFLQIMKMYQKFIVEHSRSPTFLVWS